MTPLPRLAPIVAILACVPREAAPPVLPSLSATRATPAPASVRNAAPDEDRDGVPDGVDLCAGEEEVRNAYRDDDGCPDEQPVPLLRAFSGGLGLVSFVPKPRPQRGSPVVEWLSVPTRIAGGVEIHAYVPPDAFVEAATARRATFAAPVETAAYPHLRRLVVRGELPPPGVLRIESMVDHFADEAPLVGEPLAIGSEVGPCPWAPSHRLVRVRVQAADVEPPPRTYVLVVDVTRSMGNPERLKILQQGARGLIAGLGPRDRVAVIGFAGSVEVALRPTAADEPEKILAAIDGLRVRAIDGARDTWTRIAGKDRRWTHAVVDPGLRDLATTSNDFRFTAAVAELGLIVHGGPRGSASVEQVQALAAGAVGRDPSGERREFGAMVQQQRAVFAARIDEWAAEDTWLREHPLDASTPAIRAASRLPADVQPSGSPRPVRVARRPNARRSGWSAPRRYGGSSSSRRTCRPRSSRSGRRGPRIGRTTATRRRTGACASTSCSEGSNSETRWSGLEVATLPAVDQQETHRAQAGVPAVASELAAPHGKAQGLVATADAEAAERAADTRR